MEKSNRESAAGLPLQRKILLAMIVPALLICTVGIAGIVSLSHLKSVAGRILSHNYHTIEEAREMERMLRLVETAFFETHLGAASFSDTTVSGFERSLIRCEQNITEQGEREILQKIRVEWKTLLSQDSLKDARNPTLQDLQASNQIAGSLYGRIDRLVAINEKAMFAYEEQTRRTANLSLFAVATALILAVGALVSFSLISARRISGPIVQVSARLHQALNPEMSNLGPRRAAVDEIALLKEELEKLLERLARYEDEQRRRLLHMQSRLAFVINEVLEGLVLIDSERNIVAVNRVAGQILGMGENEAKRLDDIQPRQDIRAMLKPILDGTFQPERDLGELRFTIGQQERIYRPRALTISGDLGKAEGYLLLFWDVTEQRRFEDSRRKFISMLSHQLKTPMTSLSMSVNLLKEKLTANDASQAELLSIAADDCNSLASLVSDLIEAAREPTSDLSYRLRQVDLTKLIRAALRPLIPQAQEKGITLTVPEERPVLAWVDPVKFPWVITNIAGNALRYTGKGGIVRISITSGKTRFAAEISDSGAGIAQEDLAYVFEPYTSLDSEPEHGTHGLGLAIAKEIVEAHRGTISVESQVGEGTMFHISVPLDSREAS